MLSQLKLVCSLFLFFFVSMQAQASELTQMDDDSRVFGAYTVYFTTFNSLFIPADIAKLHKLTRAKDQTLINIAIKETATGAPVPAKVQAIAKNLLQQTKTVTFQTIQEADAVYYLGALRHTNEELFHIDVTVRVEGSQNDFTFRITRKLYTES